VEELTPLQVVAELDRYIVGQFEAKKAVAIALRNRYRRRLLPPDLRDEVVPKNILMIGPTGVGKTEIARRLAKLVKAPFVKVEATKFTEVGYVGRDVESMVRDLVETSIRTVKSDQMGEVMANAAALAEDRILDILLNYPKRKKTPRNPLEYLFSEMGGGTPVEENTEDEAVKDNRQTLRKKLADGELEETVVEMEIEEKTSQMFEIFSGSGMEEMGINIQDMMGNFLPKRRKKRRLPVKDARKVLTQEEAQKLLDMDEIISIGIDRAEQSGIIFIDEIDKIAGRENTSGPDVSRGGVQRDILPIIEGSTVITKYGPVKTDYMLFIAAGAFHASKPSDLIPELQGRFPIRVELKPLTRDDFIKILTEPDNSLIRQYSELLKTENISIKFTKESLEEVAEMADVVNARTENIGARRLYTIMEKVLEDLSFNATELSPGEIGIDEEYVRERLSAIVKDYDLSRYIL
jgi:ATP-dependent HslUV protease ATP-binding subunit HslU